MKRINKNRLLIGICIAIFLAGLAGSAWVLHEPHSSWVSIMQDGRVIYDFDLSVTEDQIIDIEYEGRVNTVQIENGRIRVLEADCPDKTCVHMGWLDSGALPIVCLPNRLSIEYSSAKEDVDIIVR